MDVVAVMFCRKNSDKGTKKSIFMLIGECRWSEVEKITLIIVLFNTGIHLKRLWPKQSLSTFD